MLRVQYGGKTIRFSFEHIMDIGYEVGLQGMTSCRLIVNDADPDPWPVVQSSFSGQSFCSALDVFDKEKGRKIALSRALDESKLDKATRTEVWNRYFSRNMTNRQYQEAQKHVA